MRYLWGHAGGDGRQGVNSIRPARRLDRWDKGIVAQWKGHLVELNRGSHNSLWQIGNQIIINRVMAVIIIIRILLH